MKKLFSLFVAVALILSIGSLALLAGADYVPSVQFDDAPVIVPPSVAPEDLPSDYDPDDEIVGVIIDGEGQETYVPRSSTTIISLKRAYQILDDDTQDEAIVEMSRNLINVYEAIKTSVTESITGIDEFAGKLGFVKPEYVIKNIFEFSVDGGIADDEDIRVIFENTMDVVDGGFIVAHQVDGEWVIVDKDKVVFDGDNVVVEFDSLCPVVFLSVEESAGGEDVTTGGEDVTTGEDETTASVDDDVDKPNNAWVWIVVSVSVVAVGGGVTVFVLYKKGIIRFKK